MLSIDEAKPLLLDPNFAEPLIIATPGESGEVIDSLRFTEAAIAFRFGCIATDPETQQPYAHIRSNESIIWKLISKAYEKNCHTSAKEFFTEIVPTDDEVVTANYTLPLGALGRHKTAVVATYEYTPHEQASTRILHRRKIGAVTLGQNKYFEAPPVLPNPDVRSFSANTIFRTAQTNGRAGAYRV